MSNTALWLRPLNTRVCLALQLHFPFEVRAARVGLVNSPPERPCENAVDRDAPLSELDSDATDFLDDQRITNDVWWAGVAVFF